jgi:hypothetical protein
VIRPEDDLDELQTAYVAAHKPAEGGEASAPNGEALHETVALLSSCLAKDVTRMLAMKGRRRCVAVLRCAVAVRLLMSSSSEHTAADP